MTNIDVAFMLLALTLATALIARRTSIPAPVLFAAVGIAGGAAWHLVPGLPAVRMPPDVVLFAFLPPLLMTAAYALPLQAFRRNILPIILLAVGLVIATMGVAAVVGHVLTGLSWAAAFVLGAIIAPPDPVAATAVASKTGLSHRLVVILEGEGLVNDAVAIVAYGIAVNALISGHFVWGEVFWSLWGCARPSTRRQCAARSRYFTGHPVSHVSPRRTLRMLGRARRGHAWIHAAVVKFPGVIACRASGRAHGMELPALCQHGAGISAARIADRRDCRRLAGS
jgi:hypothetical protein